jgi:hypothetical protein
VVEEVCRGHRADEAGLVEDLLEPVEFGATLRLGSAEGHEVVVVEADAPDT